MKLKFLLVIVFFFSCSFHETDTVVAPSGLILRTEPNIKSKTITTIPYGKTVIVLNSQGPVTKIDDIEAHWIKISYNFQVGWVFGGYLLKQEKVSSKKNSTFEIVIFGFIDSDYFVPLFSFATNFNTLQKIESIPNLKHFKRIYNVFSNSKENFVIEKIIKYEDSYSNEKYDLLKINTEKINKTLHKKINCPSCAENKNFVHYKLNNVADTDFFTNDKIKFKTLSKNLHEDTLRNFYTFISKDAHWSRRIENRLLKKSIKDIETESGIHINFITDINKNSKVELWITYDVIYGMVGRMVYEQRKNSDDNWNLINNICLNCD